MRLARSICASNSLNWPGGWAIAALLPCPGLAKIGWQLFCPDHSGL
jgi:hypothetical protein